jgi:hypothetical protein
MMMDVKTWVPQGLFEGRDPIVSERLVRLIARTGGPRSAPQRIVVHLAPGADARRAEDLFAEHPTFRARERLPGVYELHARVQDVELIADHSDLFSWLDAGGRVTGPEVRGAGATVRIRIHRKGAAKEEEKSVKASTLGDLLKRDDVEAIDIEKVE